MLKNNHTQQHHSLCIKVTLLVQESWQKFVRSSTSLQRKRFDSSTSTGDIGIGEAWRMSLNSLASRRVAAIFFSVSSTFLTVHPDVQFVEVPNYLQKITHPNCTPTSNLVFLHAK